MTKPIINSRSVRFYCRYRARFKAKKEFEQLAKDIIDLCIEETPKQRKIIKKKQLYGALIKKADSLRDYVNAIRESNKEIEISAETLLENFRLLVLLMNSLIADAKKDTAIFTEDVLKGYLSSDVKDFEKELITFINQFKDKSSTSLN